MNGELLSRRQEINRVFHNARRRAEVTRRGRLEFDALQDWADDVYPTGGWRAWIARRLAPQEVAYLDLAEARAMLTDENDTEREMKNRLKELWGGAPSSGVRKRFLERIDTDMAPDVVETSLQKNVASLVYKESNHTELVAPEPTYQWTGYKREEAAAVESAEDRAQRVVRVFKESPKGMIIQPRTLEEFTTEQLKNARRGRPEDLVHDMQEIAAFILDKPVTGYVKPITHAKKFSVEGVQYRLQRFTPKRNHDLNFVTDKATKLRAIFAQDDEGVVFKEFVDHDDFDQTRRWMK